LHSASFAEIAGLAVLGGGLIVRFPESRLTARVKRPSDAAPPTGLLTWRAAGGFGMTQVAASTPPNGFAAGWRVVLLLQATTVSKPSAVIAQREELTRQA
jgi:hypothetical protein